MDSRQRDKIAAGLRGTAASERWSPWRLVQAVHHLADCPTLLMAWRLASGATQSEVACGLQGLAADLGTPCAPSPNCQQMSRWENGHERVGKLYRPLFCLWFRTTLERLGLGADDDPVVTLVSQPSASQAVTSTEAALAEEDDVERRQFLSIAAAAPVAAALTPSGLDDVRARMNRDLRHTLPTDEVERWQLITSDHVTAYGATAPATMLRRMAPDLADLAELARSYPRERDLNLAAARMCGLVGALHTDLGQDRLAREWLHTAAGYARHSGHLAQQYWTAMAQAMGAFYAPTPHPSRVVQIAEDTRRDLGDITVAPAAQLAGLSARAHAMIPDHQRQARDALDNAQRLFDQLTPAHTGERFWGFPEAEMLMYRSQVLTRIGSPNAWEAQDSALAAYPGDDPMDRPLILLDRARHLAARKNADAAAHTATNALESLAPALRVPLLIEQAKTLTRDLHSVSPTVADHFSEQLTTLAA